jgi:hypothetical protein
LWEVLGGNVNWCTLFRQSLLYILGKRDLIIIFEL